MNVAEPRRYCLEFEGTWDNKAKGWTALLYVPGGLGVTGWDLADCLQMLRVITHLDDLPAFAA